MGRPAPDFTGRQFGDWSVVGMIRAHDGKLKCLCRCKCGTEAEREPTLLSRGKSKCCGKCRYKATAERNRVHGHSPRNGESRAYQSWQHMRQRCLNPKARDYPYYGGRGIKICERWNEYANFLADMGECPAGLTIDRYPNNDGDYEPDNCRWATRKQQVEGKRGNFIKGKPGRRGSQAPWAKLSDAEVAAIRAMRGVKPQREIGLQFGISQSMVSMIQTGRSWNTGGLRAAE